MLPQGPTAPAHMHSKFTVCAGSGIQCFQCYPHGEHVDRSGRVECQVLGKGFWRRSRQTREEQGKAILSQGSRL